MPQHQKHNTLLPHKLLLLYWQEQPLTQPASPEPFITRWQANRGGQERANYALFLSELCDVLGVTRPDPAGPDTAMNAYVLERAVTFREAGDRIGNGRIDLYKRGCFVLEAKQTRWKGGPKEIRAETDLFGETVTTTASKWDVAARNARAQAENYARALPVAEGWPPFILVCDVGHCIEVFADFSGQGKNYAQFPDRQGFRILLEDLRTPEIRTRLGLIWTDPHSLDPTKHAVRASRQIAGYLAEVSKRLEAAKHNAEEVAHFLMRCLFTMFAEDMGLLPENSFSKLLERCAAKPEIFTRMVEGLWRAMDKGDFSEGIEAEVRRFNGSLFRNARAFPLEREDIGALLTAAKANWTEVDPSIFGTLLEQALDPAERSRLGAHYTPRAYVERLVIATIMEPLRADWVATLGTIEKLKADSDAAGALKLASDFLDKLVNTRVLDPACGTGNFLYVALELMKRLEGEVLEALANLGAGQETLRGLTSHEVDPHQFHGLELNPRARQIAELVLWIGFLQWHKRNRGELPEDPVLKDYKNIEHRDAVLDWDGTSNPRRSDWPEAEFIVGNPPFIGGKDIRSKLGDAYTEALWKAHPAMNDSADFVMYWWDRAAEILTAKGSKLRRFGLVTTNSITQVFQRRVVERHLTAKSPLSLVMAIPDHPWTKATQESAAVRIAMTVAMAGTHEGRLLEVTREAALDTDDPQVTLSEATGRINADLTVGVDVASVSSLQANAGLGYRGMQLIGSGFIVTPAEAAHLGLGKRPGLENHIRQYRNGRDITNHPRDVLVIDLFGLDERAVRRDFPEVYQHVLQTVKPERDANNRDSYKKLWWVFGEPRKDLRPALAHLPRYIATVETAKHRIFQFLDAAILPDNRLVCMALSDAYDLGVLSSRIHVIWALETGGTLEDRPIYTKSQGFDPFPFPDPDPATRAEIAALAEEIDAHRKRAQADHGVTLTQMYNVLELLRAGAVPTSLQAKDHDIWQNALIGTLKHLHERLDHAVANAYGWPADLSEPEILSRLVALNKERIAEESTGKVRWLRPEYQIPRFGTAPEKLDLLGGKGTGLTTDKAVTKKPAFPKSDIGQTHSITLILARATEPLSASDIARSFSQGRKVEDAVAKTLRALTRMGELASEDGRSFYLRKAA